MQLNISDHDPPCCPPYVWPQIGKTQKKRTENVKSRRKKIKDGTVYRRTDNKQDYSKEKKQKLLEKKLCLDCENDTEAETSDSKDEKRQRYVDIMKESPHRIVSESVSHFMLSR